MLPVTPSAASRPTGIRQMLSSVTLSVTRPNLDVGLQAAFRAAARSTLVGPCPESRSNLKPCGDIERACRTCSVPQEQQSAALIAGLARPLAT